MSKLIKIITILMALTITNVAQAEEMKEIPQPSMWDQVVSHASTSVSYVSDTTKQGYNSSIEYWNESNDITQFGSCLIAQGALTYMATEVYVNGVLYAYVGSAGMTAMATGGSVIVPTSAIVSVGIGMVAITATSIYYGIKCYNAALDTDTVEYM